MSRTVTPRSSMTGRVSFAMVLEAGRHVFVAYPAKASQVWMPNRLLGTAPGAVEEVRSECVTPRPATIQFSAPGVMIWSAPVLSR
jgi:hypothetical protein